MQTNPQYKIENVLFSTDSVDKHVHIVVFIPVTFITPNTINTRQQKKNQVSQQLNELGAIFTMYKINTPNHRTKNTQP